MRLQERFPFVPGCRDERSRGRFFGSAYYYASELSGNKKGETKASGEWLAWKICGSKL